MLDLARIIPGFLLLSTLASVLSAAEPDRAGVEFFEKRIRPVLVKHCYECHSPQAKQVQGGLLLDTREAIRRGGDSGPTVVPGKPEQSLLLEALRHQTFEMPPSGKLPDAVIADFETWIRSGAPDPRDGTSRPVRTGIDWDKARSFWAFQPIRDPHVPEVANSEWPASPIDHFILARLEEKELEPSPPADKRTLIRRAYFDLIGLPPAPEEIDAFLADESPEAFAHVVDRLLDSPHFGERWGRHWLDVLRFAESSGGGRELLYMNAWRFRDYVIESFNRDKPHDQFIAELVAGDLLPHETPEERAEQLTATGFLVFGPTNYELQDKERLRMDVVDEQIDTIGKAFLGMTIGCARCHDHKFDPIPARDYYALAGIFRSTKTLTPGNVSGYVQRELPVSEAHQRQLDAHAARLKPAEKRLQTAQAELKKLQSRLAKLTGRSAAATARIESSTLPGIVIDDEQARTVGTWVTSTFTAGYIGPHYRHDQNNGKGEKSITFQADLPAPGEYEVRLAYRPGGNRAANVPVVVDHAGGEESLEVDQRQAPPIDDLFVSLGRFRFNSGRPASVTLLNRGTNGHVIADAVQFLPADAPVAAKAEPPEAASLRSEVVAAEERVKGLERKLAALKKQAPPPPPQVMAVIDEQETADYQICIRGDVHNLGADAPRGFLTVAAVDPTPAIAEGESGRRELAAWLGSRDNPLTARVAVNRIWKHLTGEGIVRTVDNFGSTGEPPSHPELLDWFATRFIEDGWSTKQTIRRIVLSRTYQQSSRPRPAAARADPENRLLARMNRRRLDAEALRDAILTVSGQLDPAAGGPTIEPGTRSELRYKFNTVRRSVYVPVFRNNLLEIYEVFDFADPNLVIGRRNTSTLPTQALYLMNSPFVMEQAAHTADRLLADPGLTDADRIQQACQLALGRPPTPRELELALEYLGTMDDELKNATDRNAWASFCQALFASLDFRYVD